MSHKYAKLALLLSGALVIGTGRAPCNTNVLLDGFNDGNFAGWTVQSGTWIVSNNTLVGHRNPPGLDAYIFTGDTNWTDFVFEVDLSMPHGNAGVVFRSTAWGTNKYELDLWGPAAGSYSNRFTFSEQNNGVATYYTHSIPGNVDGNAMSPVPITENVHLRVEAIGSLLSFYVNDALMYEVDDATPLSNGIIGLNTIWNQTAGFDNVSVTLVPEANVIWALLIAGFIGVAVHSSRRSSIRKTRV